MSYEPSRPGRGRTLRFRLMAWNAAVVIITALVTLLGLREGVRITLIRELDQLLVQDVREIELSLANGDGANSLQLQQQLDRKPWLNWRTKMGTSWCSVYPWYTIIWQANCHRQN